MARCMLKEVRRHAGLGNPPAAYYNNIPESANAMIKRGVGFKESEMSTFCKDISILLLRQKEDIESAIFNYGPYRLAPKFSSFEVSPDSWFQMSTKQKETCVRKFHGERMSKEDDTNVSPQSSTSSHEQIRVSTDLADSGLTSAPVVTLQSISDKAEKLLNKVGSVVRVPGCADSTAFMVESQTSVKPHYVTLSKNGKVTCEDCPGWKASKICSHAVAVAEKTGTTAKYMKWLREKGPTSMNVTALVTCDSNSGTGKKGGKKSTARRKGGRTGNQAPATTVVERPCLIPTLSSSSSTIPVPIAPPPMPFQFPVVTPLSTPHPRTNSTISTPIAPPMPFQGPVVASRSTSQPSTNPVRPPNSAMGTFVIGLLQFCPPLVRSCYGCSQALKPGGVIANPPYDMTIISRMNRHFRATPGGEMMCKEGNVYFHVQLSCIRMKQPYFVPQITQVPDMLVPYLTSDHLRFLREFGLQL